MAITNLIEVKNVGGLTNEYDDIDILTEIDLIEAELYQNYYLPKRSQFSIDTDYTNFYIYPEQIHEILRLEVSVDTTVDASGYIEIASGSTTWEYIPPNNYITLTSAFMGLYDAKIVRVRFTPKIFNLIAKNMVALNLIDTTMILEGKEITTPLATKLKERVTRYKKIIQPKGFIRSSTAEQYSKYDYVSYTQSDFN